MATNETVTTVTKAKNETVTTTVATTKHSVKNSADVLSPNLVLSLSIIFLKAFW